MNLTAVTSASTIKELTWKLNLTFKHSKFLNAAKPKGSPSRSCLYNFGGSILCSTVVRQNSQR